MIPDFVTVGPSIDMGEAARLLRSDLRKRRGAGSVSGITNPPATAEPANNLRVAVEESMKELKKCTKIKVKAKNLLKQIDAECSGLVKE